MNILTALLALILTPVDEANIEAATRFGNDRIECDVALASQPYDCPDRLRWALLTISNRESAGNWSPDRLWTGISEMDSKHSLKVKARGHKVGRLQWWCPFHWGSDGFATVGPHGQFYVYNVQRLGMTGNCVPWQYMALNEVSAEVAAKRYLAVCDADVYSPNMDMKPGDGWCPTLGQVVATRRRYRLRAAAKRRQRLAERESRTG